MNEKTRTKSGIDLTSLARWTLGDLRRIASEYEIVLPDEAREILAALAERGTKAVDWTEDAETYASPQAPPWEEQWIVERWIDPRGHGHSGKWAHVVTIPTADSEAEAFDRATDEWTGLRGKDYGRMWRVREVGDLVAKATGTGGAR